MILRQELEILAAMRGSSGISIFFTKPPISLPSYIKESLLSEVSFEYEIVDTLPTSTEWPPKISDILSWPYSSFRRLSLLCQITGIRPNLRWPEFVRKKIELILASLRKPVFAIHLKRQGKGAEESDATLVNWETFLRSHSDDLFLLLGHDELPLHFSLLPNVVLATSLGLTLSEQLATAACCDGFMGMASGICTGAFFSSVPYVVFKHPLHHPEEMRIEIGNSEQLPFAGQNQKIWRKIDSFENLNQAFQLIKGLKTP